MDQLIENLRSIVGPANVLAEPDELIVYECDGLTQHRHTPRAVVFPSSTEEVSAVVRELAREGVSFAPRGAGTGLSGGALAVNRGVTIELARMRRLLKLDVENRLAVVQTGMVNAQLSRAVAPHGLYYAPDPSSNPTCTIGGNVAENAGGIHCLKYGVTTDHVVGARVVLSSGEVVDLGAAGAGDNVGFDLLGVFIGSEGTFGIATEATVKLLPLPQSVRTLLADFSDINDASRAVSAIIAAGLIPAALEMVDGATIRAVEASVFAAGLPLDAQAALLIELDGLEAGLEDEARKAETICLQNGARGVRRAADERERKKLWAARKGAFGAMGRLAPDMMLQDAVVPRSRLPEVLAETYRISAKYNLLLANVFHAGDGNLHPILCFDRRHADELRRVEGANREIVETCIRAGGTLTGEHGVGLDKSKYMPLLFSADTLDAMLAVRAAFDPTGLCNPGKIIPAPRGCGEARVVAAAKGIADGNGRAPHDDEKTPLVDEPNDSRFAAERSTHESPSPTRAATPNQTQDDTPRPGTQISVGAQIGSAQPSTRTDAGASAPTRARRVTVARADAESLRRELEQIALTESDVAEPERIVVSPASTEEAAEVLRAAARAGVAVFPAGARAWLDANSALPHSCLVVSACKLNRIISHEPADLVATVEAGVTLADLNEELARAGQWLPLDPPSGSRATAGGVVATNAAGALSSAYGSPRAFVLGMTVVLAGGRVTKVGGRVVKNVAGYDLSKLFAGSFGTLGLITEITFKLRPWPERVATLAARADRDTAFGAARRVIAARLLPASVVLRNTDDGDRNTTGEALPVVRDRWRDALLSVRFDGSALAVASQLESARVLLGDCDDIYEDRADEQQETRPSEQLASEARRAGCGEHARIRACVLPSRLRGAAALLAEFDGRACEIAEWRADACAGRLRAVVKPTSGYAECVEAIGRLRRDVQSAGGSLVVECATGELGRAFAAAGFDPWGVEASRLRVMRRVKDQLDPQGLLSPGRFFA